MAVVPVVIDSSGAVVGARVYNRAQASMQKSTMASQRVMKSLLGTMAAFAAIRSVTRTIADFELVMKQVAGVTGQTEKQMKSMIKTARELGSTTQFSATQAGEGLLFLSRAGFSAADAMKALPATLNLAIAGTLELGVAADLTSNVLAQFGLEAEDTVRVVDALIRVSNQANTDVKQLGEAMKFAGPIAGALGKSIEETAVLIGLLGDSGIQASQAGTNLRGVMLALTSPTEGAGKAIAELGLKIEDLDPATNSMQSIFAAFSIAGLKAGQAAQIFGRRNAAAALILTRANKSIDANVRALNEMNDALTISEKNADTLSGAMKALGSAFQELSIATGDAGFAGALKSTIVFLTDVVRMLAGMEVKIESNAIAVNALVVLIQFLTIRFAALLALKAIEWFIGLSKGIGLVTAAMRGLRIAFVANPIALIATVAAVAITAFINLRGEMDSTANKAKEIKEELELLTTSPLRNLSDFGEDFAGKIKTAEEAVKRLRKLIELQEAITPVGVAPVGQRPGVFTPGVGRRGELREDISGLTGQRISPIGTGQLGGQLLTSSETIKRIQTEINKLEKIRREAIIALRKQTRVISGTEFDATLDGIKNRTKALIEQKAELDNVKDKFKEIDKAAEFSAGLRRAGIDPRTITVEGRDARITQIANQLEEFGGQLPIAEIDKLTAELKKLGSVSVEERVRIEALGFAVRDLDNATRKFNEAQRSQLVKEYTKELDFEVSVIGMTDNAIEQLITRQEAYNFAISVGIKNAKEFAQAQVDKVIAIQNTTKSLDDQAISSGTLGQVLTQTADGLLDIAANSDNAAEAIKRLVLEIAKLIIREQILNAIRRGQAAVTATTTTTPAVIETETAFGNAFDSGRIVNRLALGGRLISTPTAVPVGMNLLGEGSDQEFVLPAARGADGKLGVRLSGISSGGRGGSSTDNRKLNLTQNFFDRSPDFDSFRKNQRSIQRDANDFLRKG